MAGRGPQTFKKRQKEQKRKEKQQEKMERRLLRKQQKDSGETSEPETGPGAEAESADGPIMPV